MNKFNEKSQNSPNDFWDFSTIACFDFFVSHTIRHLVTNTTTCMHESMDVNSGGGDKGTSPPQIFKGGITSNVPPTILGLYDYSLKWGSFFHVSSPAMSKSHPPPPCSSAFLEWKKVSPPPPWSGSDWRHCMKESETKCCVSSTVILVLVVNIL